MGFYKRFEVFADVGGRWYVEAQERGEDSKWVVVAGPFDDEDKAWDALDKLRED